MNQAVILAVDTTSEFGSVSVRRAGKTVADLRLESPDGFGHHIMQAIEKVLTTANTNLSEIDCFAGASGPGSFTGVRVGLAAIKGLAEAMGKPAAAISNLRALSLSGQASLRAVVLDARRGEVYGATYDDQAHVVSAETVSPFDSWLKSIPKGAEIVGWENGPCQQAGLVFTKGAKWLAAAVAECAEKDGPNSWNDPIVIDANYVRRSDAELFWKDV